MIYCPYTDQELNKFEISSEHIIPLSLGGINGLEIPVCRKKNSQLGSNIDGKIGSELIIQSARTKYETRSQSGKIANLHFKSVKDGETNLPIQATISKKDGINIYAPYVPKDKSPPTGATIKISCTSDLDIWIKYVAKTFLSAGYYAYGDDFRNHVDTKALRLIMDCTNEELKRDHFDAISYIHAHYIYMDDYTDQLKAFRFLCKHIEGASCICLIPDDAGFTCFTSILGVYVGTIRVKTDGFIFPDEGHYQMGHFICVQNGKLVRISFASLLDKFKGSI